MRKPYKRTTTKKFVGVKMPRRYRRYIPRFRARRRRKSTRLPILPTVALAYQFFRKAPSGRTIVEDIQKTDFNAAIYDVKEIFLGIDAQNNLRPDWLMNTYAPIIGAAIGSIVLDKIGVNRRIVEKVPIIGKWIKL
jgi:hypothetical protein